MTLIQKIQKHSYILVLLIFIALISFLFMDINQNASMLGQSMSDVGEVAGESISYEEFDKLYKKQEQELLATRGGQPLNEQEQTQLRNQIWQKFVNENAVEKNLEKLGISVTSAELAELTMGENADQSVKQIPGFSNAQGQFDPVLVSSFVKSLKSDPAKKKQWMQFEEQLKSGRLQNKFSNLIEMSFFIPKWLKDFDFNTFSKTADFDYVYVPFSSIKDTDVKIDEKEMKSFFEKNKRKFSDDQEYIKVTYALFPILPSAADSVELFNEFNKKIAEMKSATNDTNFMRSYADNSYDLKMYKREDLSRFQNVDEIMAAPVGGVVGPFVVKNQLKAIKVLNKRNIADSVQVKEIKISFQNFIQNQDAIKNRMKLVDSVFRMLDTLNMNFDQVSAQFNDNKGPNTPQWVYSAANDLPKEIFEQGGIKKYFKAQSNTEPAVRILHVVNYPATIPAVQIGEISGAYAPSEATSSKIYNDANSFKNSIKTAKDMEKNIVKYPGARTNSAYLTPAETQIGGIEGSPRELLKWAYESKNNDVSGLITIGNHYVIAINQGSRNIDKIEFEMCKDEVKELYINELKGNKIKEGMAKSTSLAETASKFGAQVATATQVKFQDARYAGTPEPAPLAYMMYAPMNKLSKPIKGFGGYIQIVPKAQGSLQGDPTAMLDLQQQIQMQYKGIRGVVEAMISKSKVVDRRFMFF